MAAFVIHIVDEIPPVLSFPSWLQDRPETYDPELVYGEEAEDWITNDARGGGRFKNRTLVIDELGAVFISD